jgi:serine protease AprX
MIQGHNVQTLSVPKSVLANPGQSLRSQYQVNDISGVYIDSINESNIVVCVVDTGVDSNHPLIQGSFLGQYDIFTNKQTTVGSDGFGHGTHVAGIIRTIAPKVSIFSIKVLNDEGAGSISSIIAGLDYVLSVKGSMEAQGKRVIANFSLGGSNIFCWGTCPICKAVNRVVVAGVPCMVAAGNFGPKSYSTSCPGKAHRALVVGACDSEGNITNFSSRSGSFSVEKPDVMAMGWKVVSAKANTRDVFALSGTSMATPVATGIVAKLISTMVKASVNKTFDFETVKAQIKETATGTKKKYVTGSGIIDGNKSSEKVMKQLNQTIRTPEEMIAETTTVVEQSIDFPTEETGKTTDKITNR